MKQDEAETLAAQALAWIAAQDDLLNVFMSSTGCDVETLRAGDLSSELLGAVLDFLLMDDAWVIGFCASAEVSHDSPLRARAALPGGAMVHWT